MLTSEWDDENYFTQSESEKIFVMGISSLPDDREITQVDLLNTSKKCIGEINKPTMNATQFTDAGSKAKSKGELFHHWYQMHEGTHHPSELESLTYGHTEKITPGNFFDCNRIVDMWFRWFLTTPRPKNPYSNIEEGNIDESGLYGSENVFLMEYRNTSAYFTTAAPFRAPDIKSIKLTKAAPLLLPVYNICASQVTFPSLDDDNKLLEVIISDLLGIIPGSVKATLDGQTIEPCCVIRKKEPLKVENIPVDNVFGIPKDRLDRSGSTLSILHGGFWLLIRPEALASGDHLLEWKVESVNYKMDAHIRIGSLV
jgi:hypothetical protein